MGSCLNSSDATTLEKLLDEELRSSRKADEQIKKILFLGNGGSGKSTLCKQLRLIHDDKYPDDFRRECITYIHQQIIEDMKLAIDVYVRFKMRKTQSAAGQESDGRHSVSYSIDFREDDLWMFDQLDMMGLEVEDVKSAEIVREYYYDKQSQTLSPEICDAIKILRDDPAIQRIWDCRNITHLQTSTKYFWENLETIADPNYLPSEQDILLHRRRTCKIREYRFTSKENGQTMHLIDIGGQKSQRRKWIHCFDHVVAVIFVANISNYDESLEEDDTVNAMCDQIELFRDIVSQKSSRFFVILFLNKEDLFREKYCKKQVPLSKCSYFSDWKQEEGDWSFEPAAEFISEQFEDQNDGEPIISHFTTAISTRNVRTVFDNVHEIIISKNMLSTGLVSGNNGWEMV